MRNILIGCAILVGALVLVISVIVVLIVAGSSDDSGDHSESTTDREVSVGSTPEVISYGSCGDPLSVVFLTGPPRPPVYFQNFSTGMNALVRLQDDFSDTSSGWDYVQKSKGKSSSYHGYYYDNGKYQVRIRAPRGSALIRVLEDAGGNAYDPPEACRYGNDVIFDNAMVAAEATRTDDASKGAGWGLVCRANDRDHDGNYDHFYAAAVHTDGRATILKQQGDKVTLLGSDEARDVLKEGTVTNHLLFDCTAGSDANLLTLYINGYNVVFAEDGTFKSGKVGLYVSSPEESPGINVSYDNFVVAW